MPIRGMQPLESLRSGRSRKGSPAASRLLALALATLTFMPAAQLLFCADLAAQTPASAAPPATRTQTGQPAGAHHRRKRTAAAKPAAAPALPAAPVTPPVPPLPNWPANKKPNDAHVTWDSHGLFIQASNSSLDQILSDVALKTGAKIQGMGADERIFGSYGPGPVRDVLNQLLDGSGYNILMVGDQDGGAPLRIVLSGRPTGAAPSAGSGNTGSDGDTENNQEAEQPAAPAAGPSPVLNPVAPAVPLRTPQQMYQYRQQMLPTQPQGNQQNPPN